MRTDRDVFLSAVCIFWLRSWTLRNCRHEMFMYLQFSGYSFETTTCPRLVHDWGETLEQGTEPPNCSPGAASSAASCTMQVCALGWVKCREHISLLVILCIIVYVTNKANLSLIWASETVLKKIQPVYQDRCHNSLLIQVRLSRTSLFNWLYCWMLIIQSMEYWKYIFPNHWLRKTWVVKISNKWH